MSASSLSDTIFAVYGGISPAGWRRTGERRKRNRRRRQPRPGASTVGRVVVALIASVARVIFLPFSASPAGAADWPRPAAQASGRAAHRRDRIAINRIVNHASISPGPRLLAGLRHHVDERRFAAFDARHGALERRTRSFGSVIGPSA